MSRDKIAARQFLSPTCLAITHAAGVILKEKNALSCERETAWEAFQETIRARVIESQKLSRDSGETIFTVRHQGVSQGPLG